MDLVNASFSLLFSFLDLTRLIFPYVTLMYTAIMWFYLRGHIARPDWFDTFQVYIEKFVQPFRYESDYVQLIYATFLCYNFGKWYWKGIRRWKKWPNRLDLSVGDSQQDQSNSKENRLIARVRSHYTGNFGSSISDYHYLHNRICMVRSSCSLVKVVHDLGWNRLRQVGFYLLPDNSELSLLLLLYERIKQ